MLLLTISPILMVRNTYRSSVVFVAGFCVGSVVVAVATLGVVAAVMVVVALDDHP